MTVLSNWSALVEGLSTSVQDTYTELESALNVREVPELEISRVEYSESGLGSAKREYCRIQRKDFVFDICAAPFGKSFFFSWWMAVPPLPLAPLWTIGFFALVLFGSALLYYPLRDSCLGILMAPALPIGMTLLLLFLMKAGVVLSEGHALRIPGVSRLYRLLFAPSTYYSADTQAMFEATVHSALLEVIDGKISEQGLRALAPQDRIPTSRPKLNLGSILGMFK